MAESRETVISLHTDSGQSLKMIQKALWALRKYMQLTTASSVYKVPSINERADLSHLSMVVKARTLQSPIDLNETLNRVEKQLQQEAVRKPVQLGILIYGYEVALLNGFGLPHPEMHLRPDLIVPALEVWPEYKHPVLKESLRVLAQKLSTKNWGEFFAQGNPLLDFSSPAE